MIRVSIVEDDKRVRENLAALITRSRKFCCVGAFPNANVALKQMPRDWPDVVLMDINLPNMSGIECVGELKEMRPALQIIMVTAYSDDEQIFESLKRGASGYLLKRTPPAEILEAIEEVFAGGAPMSNFIARKVVHHFQTIRSPKSVESLTPREKEILDCLVKGLRNKEIADALGVSAETIRAHLRNIYDKLHVTSRTEAVVKYLNK